MNKLLLPIISCMFILPASANESPFSISIGKKTIHTDISSNTDTEINLTPKASSSALYTNISYNHTPSISYSFEYASFSEYNEAEILNLEINSNFNENDLSFSMQTKSKQFKTKVKPTNYFSLHAQYTFRPAKTIKPYLFTGLSYISADITNETIEKINNVTTKSGSNTESDSSTGFTYGAGLDITLYKNFSFIFDYRIQQNIVDRSADEISGAFKYRF